MKTETIWRFIFTGTSLRFLQDAEIGTCSVSGFVDDTVINLLDLSENEIPIYSISLGKKK